jgi:hypothetical protein
VFFDHQLITDNAVHQGDLQEFLSSNTNHPGVDKAFLLGMPWFLASLPREWQLWFKMVFTISVRSGDVNLYSDPGIIVCTAQVLHIAW